MCIYTLLLSCICHSDSFSLVIITVSFQTSTINANQFWGLGRNCPWCWSQWLTRFLCSTIHCCSPWYWNDSVTQTKSCLCGWPWSRLLHVPQSHFSVCLWYSLSWHAQLYRCVVVPTYICVGGHPWTDVDMAFSACVGMQSTIIG